MDYELLNRIGVLDTDPQKIIDELEAKKLDFEERMENMEDDARIKQVQEKMAQLDELIVQARQELKKQQEEAEKGSAANDGKKSKKNGEADLIAISDDELKAEDEIPIAIEEEEETAKDKNKGTGVSENESQKKKDAKKSGKNPANKEKNDQAHDRELEKRAAEIQKKAEKARKEAEKKAAQEMKNAGQSDDAQSNNANNQTNQTDATKQVAGSETVVNEYGKAFTDGLAAYGNKNYAEAEKQFMKIGLLDKAKKVNKAKIDKAEGGNACYLLGQIYRNGFNGNQDETRAQFWFKRAADLYQNSDAARQYGLYCATKKPKNSSEDHDNVDEALRYLEMSAEAGNKGAKNDYIATCTVRTIVKNHKRKAIQYIDEFISEESDGYIKKNLEDKKSLLKKKETRSGTGGTKSKGARGDAATILAFVGALISLYATLNMSAGAFYDTGCGILMFEKLPNVDFLANNFLDSLFEHFTTNNAGYPNMMIIESSMVLLFIASFLMGLDYDSELFLFNLIKGISLCGLSFVAVASAATYSILIDDAEIAAYAIGFVLVATVYVVIGMLIAKGIGKIIAKKNNN